MTIRLHHLMGKKPLFLVAAQNIPRVVKSCPTNDLVDLYGYCILLEELCNQEQGFGLSAVQVGIDWNLYVFAKEHQFYVDCTYEPIGDDVIESLEGCLSLRKNGVGRLFIVKRHASIRLTGFQLTAVNGQLELVLIDKEVVGIDAIVHQHEADHGKGVLISDIGIEYEVW